MNEASKEVTLKINGVEVDYVRKDSIEPFVLDEKVGGWQIGQAYFIMTVTAGIHGIVLGVDDHEIWVLDAAWIADTGRCNEFLSGKIQPNEIEPFPEGAVIPVGRGALLYAVPMPGSLFRKTK